VPFHATLRSQIGFFNEIFLKVLTALFLHFRDCSHDPSTVIAVYLAANGEN